MPQMDEYNTADVPKMSKVALGNLIPDPKAVEAIVAETEKRHKKGHKAAADAWRRSKNKVYRRKIARQLAMKQGGANLAEFAHTRKKGR